MLKIRCVVGYIAISSSIIIYSTSVWSQTTTTNSPNMTQTTEQYASDSDITARIKSDLLIDRNISSLSISVITTHGKVTLSGSVHSTAQKHKVVAIARKVAGVKSIKDKLVVNTSN